MSHLTYLTFAVVTEDELSQKKQNRLAKDAYDAFMVTVEPDDIGLIKVTDVDYDVPAPWGHTHVSKKNDACVKGEHSCYVHAMDEVHPTDNE